MRICSPPRPSLELFHERGYPAVSLDDIGAQVGMAGPSIYHHFATKADLLVAAERIAEELHDVTWSMLCADPSTLQA